MATNGDQSDHRHIWVITGPAGCGKTSVAEYLSTTCALPYLEGDNFHTPENIEKMANGHPLNDADRWDWLIELRERAIESLNNNKPNTQPQTNPNPNSHHGVIVTCSALKRKYRDVLRIAAYHDRRVHVHFLFLSAAEAVLLDRVRARKGHYMKDYMVKSQFGSLELPAADEVDVLSVDAGGAPEEVDRLALGVVEGILGKERRRVGS